MSFNDQVFDALMDEAQGSRMSPTQLNTVLHCLSACKAIFQGQEVRPLVEEYSWEELKTYHIAVFPNIITVTTNCDKDEFAQAVEIFKDCIINGENQNIEQILHRHGFAAVTAVNQIDQVYHI
jgi:hypothetical protein